ncbi:unnamed protein product [Prunus brigantina]
MADCSCLFLKHHCSYVLHRPLLFRGRGEVKRSCLCCCCYHSCLLRRSELKLSLLLLLPQLFALPCVAGTSALYCSCWCQCLVLLLMLSVLLSLTGDIVVVASSVFCLICCRAHRVSVFFYVPYIFAQLEGEC